MLEENSAPAVSVRGVPTSAGGAGRTGGAGMSYLCPALRGWGHSWVKWCRLSDEEQLAVNEKSPSLFEIQEKRVRLWGGRRQEGMKSQSKSRS